MFRPNAWPYRDWVVDALNRDLSYEEFVWPQLTGDVFRPNDPDALRAMGFLTAGAFDTVGQDQQIAAMRKVVRQDELEDFLAFRPYPIKDAALPGCKATHPAQLASR